MKLKDIKLDPVHGSSGCQYSMLENKLRTLYENQEKLLEAIKALSDGIYEMKLDILRRV